MVCVVCSAVRPSTPAPSEPLPPPTPLINYSHSLRLALTTSANQLLAQFKVGADNRGYYSWTLFHHICSVVCLYNYIELHEHRTHVLSAI